MKKIIILGLLALFTGASSQAYEVRKLLSSLNPVHSLSQDKTALYWGIGIAAVTIAGVGGAYYYFKHYRKSPAHSAALPLNSEASNQLKQLPAASPRINLPTTPATIPSPAAELSSHNIPTILQQPVGLHNFRNSCYFNATLQALYHTGPIKEVLTRHNNAFKGMNLTSSAIKPNQFEPAVRLSQFIVDYNQLNTPQPIVERHSLFDQLKSLYAKCAAQMYRDSGTAERNRVDNNAVTFNQLNRQHDASELLNTLIDQLREIKSGNAQEDSERNQLFTIRVGSKLSSPHKHPSLSVQNENILLVNIHGANPTVQNCIDAHSAPEKLDDTITTQQLLIVQPAPNVIPVVLKRFVYNPDSGQIERDGKAVHIDDKIQLPVEHEHNNTQSTQSYTLNSIVAHLSSNGNNGHYISYVKNAHGQWYCCDDTKITPLTWEQVRDNCAKTAYVLMYEKTNTH